MTRRLLLSYLSLAALLLLCLEIPLGFVYSRGERERVTTVAKDEAESIAAYASLSIDMGNAERELPGRVARCAQRTGGLVVIVNRTGQLLASSHELSQQNGSLLQMVLTHPPGSQPGASSTPSTHGECAHEP